MKFISKVLILLLLSCSFVKLNPLKLPVPFETFDFSLTRKISSFIETPVENTNLILTIENIEKLSEEIYSYKLVLNENNKNIYYLKFNKNKEIYSFFSKLIKKEVNLIISQNENERFLIINDPVKGNTLGFFLTLYSFPTISNKKIFSTKLNSHNLSVIFINKATIFETEQKNENLVMKFHYPLTISLDKYRFTLNPGEKITYENYDVIHFDTFEKKIEDEIIYNKSSISIQLKD